MPVRLLCKFEDQCSDLHEPWNSWKAAHNHGPWEAESGTESGDPWSKLVS